MIERRHHEIGVVRGAKTGINGIAHRADEAGLLAAAVGDVGISEVIGVQGVEGRTNAVLHKAGDLVLAQELGVDGGHVPGPRDVALADGLVSLQEHVDRGIAVGMGEQRHAQAIHLAHRLVDEVLGKGGFTPPVLLARRAAREVRGGEEGGATLGGAIDRDLHPADLEAVVVTAPLAHRDQGLHLVEVGDEGIGHHVDQVGAGIGGPLDRCDLGQVAGPLLGGGDAGLGVEHLARPAPVHLLLGRDRFALLDHRQEGRFHNQAPGLLAAGLAHDHASRRGGGGSADAVLLQGEAVQHRAMHRDMIDSHRVAWKRLIEVASVEQTTTGHHRVVVAVADQQFALLQSSLGGARLQGGEDARHILPGAGGRRVKLALVGHQQGVDVMAVAIDESGQQGLALEVDDPCARRPERQAPIPGPGEYDPAVLHAQRLDIARTLPDHGEN